MVDGLGLTYSIWQAVPDVMLVERERQLAELEAAALDAASSRGSLVLVMGEAGAGNLAGRPVRRTAAGRPVLSRLCDTLLTPRPLGQFP